jgi:hypothetical protein
MPSHDTAEDASARNYTENRNEAISSQQETLSRASVYASLKSLDNCDELSSSSITRIPKSVQDESLISFFETLSKDYHHSVPRLDGKNTSGRPLSASEISGRIRQRALTLVGGGYNAKSVVTPGSTSKRKKALHTNKRVQYPSSNLSGLHRKRKRKNLWHRLNYADMCDGKCTKDQVAKHDIQFLMRLNDEWNAYIKNVLTLNTSLDGSVIDHCLLQKQIATLAAQDLIEWVGSLVQIKDCAKVPKMKDRLVGMKGILISHSGCSWEIIPVRCKLERSKPMVDGSGKSNTLSHVAEGHFLDVHDWHHDAAITIPKFGSTIAVEIPLTSSSSFSNIATGEAQFISIVLEGT